jgi:hypothetical protein
MPEELTGSMDIALFQFNTTWKQSIRKPDHLPDKFFIGRNLGSRPSVVLPKF